MEDLFIMNNITQIIINSLITWVLQPETITTLLGLIVSTTMLVKKSKKENYRHLAYNIAQDITQELLFKPLDNDEKRNVAVTWIYNQLPSNAKKYLSEQDLIEIVNSAYHTYVKPESGKK